MSLRRLGRAVGGSAASREVVLPGPYTESHTVSSRQFVPFLTSEHILLL